MDHLQHFGWKFERWTNAGSPYENDLRNPKSDTCPTPSGSSTLDRHSRWVGFSGISVTICHRRTAQRKSEVLGRLKVGGERFEGTYRWERRKIRRLLVWWSSSHKSSLLGCFCNSRGSWCTEFRIFPENFEVEKRFLGLVFGSKIDFLTRADIFAFSRAEKSKHLKNCWFCFFFENLLCQPYSRDVAER